MYLKLLDDLLHGVTSLVEGGEFLPCCGLAVGILKHHIELHGELIKGDAWGSWRQQGDGLVHGPGSGHPTFHVGEDEEDLAEFVWELHLADVEVDPAFSFEVVKVTLGSAERGGVVTLDGLGVGAGGGGAWV